ncbi:MAG: hypothetical protein ACJ790_15015 [Myxococcaceae bacterium]
MSSALLAAIGVLLLVDAALRDWRPLRTKGARSAVYLAMPYVPMVIMPLLSRLQVTIVAAVFALGALYSYARMVGLTIYPRFFVPTVLAAAAFYVVAPVGWYALFQAMPAFAVFLVLGAAAVRGNTEAFLQKMCLSWLAVLVYGYLWAHAAVFVETDLHAFPTGAYWIAWALFAAKVGDVAWVAAKKLLPNAEQTQPVITAVGGALGGVALGLLLKDPLLLWEWIVFGLIVGAALGTGSRAYNLIVADVVGPDVERPLKGTMMFGFAFSLGLAYHYVRYLS